MLRRIQDINAGAKCNVLPYSTLLAAWGSETSKQCVCWLTGIKFVSYSGDKMDTCTEAYLDVLFKTLAAVFYRAVAQSLTRLVLCPCFCLHDTSTSLQCKSYWYEFILVAVLERSQALVRRYDFSTCTRSYL